MKITLIIIIAVLILWTIYGYFASRVEQAEYAVISNEKGEKKEYEIRAYPSHIVAETTVEGSYMESMSQGFSIVAGYIFGGNIKKERIAMTTPVMVQGSASKDVSEKIAMTSPVVIQRAGDTKKIYFVMPKGYTLDTLPTPTDKRVVLRVVPGATYAVLRFSGYRTASRIENMEKKLTELLTSDDVEIMGEPAYAGYNAPGTPPWMTRNEILIEIKSINTSQEGGIVATSTPTSPKPTMLIEDEEFIAQVLESKVVTLTPGSENKVYDITLTLLGFNHKFQDSSDKTHEWVTIEIQKNNSKETVESIDLAYSKSKGSDGKVSEFYSQEEIEGYRFQLLQLKYDADISLKVSRLAK